MQQSHHNRGGGNWPEGAHETHRALHISEDRRGHDDDLRGAGDHGVAVTGAAPVRSGHANGQSVWTFLYVSALLVPALVTIVLPVALLIAVIYAFTRLNGNSELVVVNASGAAQMTILRPVLLIGSSSRCWSPRCRSISRRCRCAAGRCSSPVCVATS